MISRAEFLQEIDKAGFRLIREVPLIPLLHAQRLVLLEKK
jgi:hypothetical protein